jgi:phospholipid/cholesterol/gamma-HCH transport system permease protein
MRSSPPTGTISREINVQRTFRTLSGGGSEPHGVVASGDAGARLLDFLKPPVAAIQDFYVLSGLAVRNLFRGPHYVDDIAIQMDIIGVGSLPIVILIGFFSGFVITMQMSRALSQYGATDQVGQIVAITLVRELGPVLTALLVAGRNASGIASELGSMKVTEQIDAMRALGTDPIKKLVTPRMIATCVMLPMLTIVADFVGLIGGYVIAYLSIGLTTTQYWTSAYQALQYNDIAQGLLKPFVFAFIISLVGCFYGLRTTGGTQGVGLATTKAVVAASVWVFVITSLITRIFVNLH